MRIETTAGELRKALKLCEPFFAGAAWAPPIMSMVKFKGNRVTATNLDVEIEVVFPSIVAEGEGLVMFRPLRKLVNALDQDEAITILRTDKVVEVIVGSGRYRLPSADIADFPEMKAYPDLQTMDLDGEAFLKALRFCMPAISTEETRYYLNGVCLSGKAIVATDGHKLAVTYDVLPAPVADAIIPHPLVRFLAKLPSVPSITIMGNTDVKAGSKTSLEMVRFPLPGITITAKLIDGTYPDWTRVVPKPGSDKIIATVETSALQRKLRRLSAVVDGLKICALIGDGSRVAVAVRDHFYGDGEVEAEDYIDASGSAFEVAFNLRYMRDALVSLGGEVVTVVSDDKYSPFLFTSDAAENRIFVVMPVRSSAEKTLEQSRLLLQRLRQDVAA